jgi:hypothetical protein
MKDSTLQFKTSALGIMESRRETNGLERSKPKDGRVRFDGAAMAGPPNQNPKGRRLIPV